MPKVEIEVNAKGNAEGKIKGLVSSILSANIATGVLKKGFELFGKILEDGVKESELMRTQLDNTKKSISNVVGVVGTELVNSFLKGSEGITNFINKAENLASVGATLKVGMDVIVQIIKDVASNVQNAISPITDLFSKIQSGGKSFNILGASMTTVNIALKLTSDFIKLVIQNLLDVGNIIIKVGKLTGDFFNVLTGKAKWKDVQEGVNDFTNAVKNGFGNVVKNTDDMIKNAINGFKDFNKNAEESAKKFENSYDEAYKNIIANAKNSNKELVQTTGEANKNLTDDTKKNNEDKKASWQDYYNNISSLQSSIMSTMQMGFENFFKNELDVLKTSNEEQLAEIDARTQRELEMLGLADLTKTEMLQNEIAILQANIQQSRSLKDNQAMQDELTEKQKELQKEQILADAEKRKEKIMKNAAKKEKELKKKQFEQNKALSIANVWINAASAVIGWWAAFASMGIPGIVLAGVMTAATLAMAGVQTGLIASQTPSFETGGVIGGNSLTGDRVQIRANSKERVLTAEQNKAFEDMVYGNSGMGSGFVNNGNINIYANDPESFRKQLIEVRRFELVR